MIKQKKKSEDPSPLQMKVCACGCEIKFQPRRSDQLHLNSKHYNYAYNHGKRKIKYAQENSANKVIRKNDRILEKYFKVFKETTQLGRNYFTHDELVPVGLTARRRCAYATDLPCGP